MIEKLIERASMVRICYVDSGGFPVTGAMLMPIEGDTLYYKGVITESDYCVQKFTAISGLYYSNFCEYSCAELQCKTVRDT